MDKYEIEAQYKRLKDKVAEKLGSEDYFVDEKGRVAMIDPSPDIFIDIIIIRDATKKEIEMYDEYRRIRDLYWKTKL